jgi:hypothetical protein
VLITLPYNDRKEKMRNWLAQWLHKGALNMLVRVHKFCDSQFGKDVIEVLALASYIASYWKNDNARNIKAP